MEVTVIIPNFNGAHLLPDAISTLTKQTASSFEILVADNGSSDASARVAQEYGARFLRLERNHGFAIANNLAAKHAKGRYLFFVSNDMRFERECLESLAKTLDDFPEAFAADCAQYRWGTKQMIHAGTTLHRGDMRSKPIPFVEVDNVGIRDQLVAVPWTCAGNMMARREAFEGLGGFDNAFFINAEDVDICMRAWMRGLGSVFVPDTRWRNAVEHKVGATSRNLRDLRLLRNPGNYVRIWLKSSSFPYALRWIGSQALDAHLRAAQGDLSSVLTWIVGFSWNAALLRGSLNERRRVLGSSRYLFEEVLEAFISSETPMLPSQVLSYLEAAKPLARGPPGQPALEHQDTKGFGRR